MALLTKDEILAADDFEYKDIDVPQWGGTIRVRVMSGEARDAWESRFVSVDDGGDTKFNQGATRNVRASLVALCACDADGNLLFTEKDVLALGKKSGVALTKIYAVCQDLNHITEEDIEELEGN